MRYKGACSLNTKTRSYAIASNDIINPPPLLVVTDESDHQVSELFCQQRKEVGLTQSQRISGRGPHVIVMAGCTAVCPDLKKKN